MSEQEVKGLEGRVITCKSRKLFSPVTGLFKVFFAGVIIVYSRNGIYGIYPHDLEFLKEAGEAEQLQTVPA